MSPAPAYPLDARVVTGAAALGVPLDEDQRRLLAGFLDLLATWNRAYNLTAVREPEQMVPQHLLDSLSVAPFILGEQVLDIGTGPGLPGIPLAVARPECRFVLLDANAKKIRFVRQAVMDLGLGNVEPVQARVESYRGRANFSTIVARAVATVAELHANAAPLLASPGRLLLMKGRYPADELEAAALGDAQVCVHRLEVPYLAGERHLVEIRHE
jgi:16S rRNA (guanine527-N7)-methyltransferase